MDFSILKSLTIPEGEVAEITCNDVLLWKIGYTNLVLTSTTDPGGTAIYNGTGWYDGMRWSSSGGKVSPDNHGRLTGWIPYKAGTLRLKNFGLNRNEGYVVGAYLVWYNSDGSISTTVVGFQSADELTYTLPVNSSRRYFRISGYNKFPNGATIPAPICTIDEEITE